ncbi:MAG TPA: single-stranded DNA-binding protein [Pirellulaceae bacterium]|nr:single-stranded DNA-binding protein [Pirellulaceae bacterium]
MASFNRVILVGNLTREIDLRHLQSGMAVTDIGLAVNDRRKTAQGEWVDETTFVDVTLWGRQAEIASEYLTKGSPVLIEGRLKLETWEKDGKKSSKLKVVGEKMQLLGGRGGGAGGGGGGGGARPQRSSTSSAPQFDESEADYGDSEPAPRGRGGNRGSSPPADEEIPF